VLLFDDNLELREGRIRLPRIEEPLKNKRASGYFRFIENGTRL